jgi:hypothetical protein
MKNFLRSCDGASKGAALMIVLAFVVLLTGLALAYFSRTTTDRQLAQSSYNDTSADLLARSSLDIVVSDFKQWLLSHPTPTPNAPYYITPVPYGTPASGQTPIPNLVRRSFSGDPTGLTSAINSTAVSANGRSITTARWNSHYLVPPASTGAIPASSPVSSFVAPDWVLITAQGPALTPAASAVIGRYAFAVYDEGGLLDMNLAGYGNYAAGGGGGGPNPSPTPWAVNVGRKGILGLADLTTLPGSPTVVTPTTSFASMSSFLTNALINSIVGWRNFANTGQSDGSFPSGFSFPGNLNKQDLFGSYLLDFGDPPYSTPSPFPIYPFTSVDTATSNSRTDQAFMTRQELLKLQSSLGFSPILLQYMGTFSRERNQPARDWNRLNGHLPDRWDITNLGLVKPNPGGTPKPNRGKGQSKGVGRGRFKGDAASILDLFGLAWVNGINTIPGSSPPQQMPTSDLRFWPHWQYIGRPGFNCNPNGNGCDHIPALRGGRNDFFQILDYAVKGQANGTTDDTVNIGTILGLAASLFDQYDYSGNGTPSDQGDDAVFPSVLTSPSPWPWPGATPRPTHTTIIQYDHGGVSAFALGWERQETNDPHGPLGKPTPTPGATPIVIDHAFTTTAELGYGLDTENGFTPLDLHTSGTNQSALLDFFTYNPVDHSFPRLGIVNLNTKNPPVLAAILGKALKRDVDVAPTPNPLPTVAPSEAMAAAQAIVTETWTNNRPALNRQDIARLTSVAASQISSSFSVSQEETDKCKETIARALSELGQARTWNLFIDVIAQTGRYSPDATNINQANKFMVEGEKRYWLHIALGRDLVSGQVDVLGTQLEEVVE